MKEYGLIKGSIVLLFALASCSPSKMTLEAESPTLVSEPPLIENVDCIWEGKGFSWMDKNRDGKYQEDEQPVPEIPFLIDDPFNNLVDVGESSVSNSKGKTDLLVWLPGCPEVGFEIYIQVPEGYELTTEPRISVDFDSPDQFYPFGLVILPGYPTATPLPPKPICRQYSLPASASITDFSVNEEGVAWLSTMGDGIFTYPAGATDLKFVKVEAGSERIYINLIKSRHGYIWIATTSGVSIFDGTSWQSYTEKDGLLNK
ncbi:hypothetical protein EG834_12140, partial [bacterium]|nr:hypothetical protein [bacterium]